MIRGNAAENIHAVFCKELAIGPVCVAWLVFGFRRNELNSSKEAREKMFAVRPRKLPLEPLVGELESRIRHGSCDL